MNLQRLSGLDQVEGSLPVTRGGEEKQSAGKALRTKGTRRTVLTRRVTGTEAAKGGEDRL